SDRARLFAAAWQLRGWSLARARGLYEWFTRSAGAILEDWFESEPLQALYGFDAVVGNYASPYTPGSAYVLLHHAVGEVNGHRGQWGHALGGMGAITQAMAARVRKLGGHIETQASVERIWIEHGQVRGLMLADGRQVRARAVAANVDPRRLYLQLVEACHLPEDFVASMRRYRCVSATFRMNVALSELPRFRGMPTETGTAHLGAGI